MKNILILALVAVASLAQYNVRLGGNIINNGKGNSIFGTKDAPQRAFKSVGGFLNAAQAQGKIPQNSSFSLSGQNVQIYNPKNFSSNFEQKSL